MTDAGLADIDDALLTALAAFAAEPQTTTKPFGYVGRYAGPVPAEGLQAPKFPCAMLRFDGDAGTRDIETYASSEDRGLAGWSVLVGVEDPQGIETGMVGTTAAPGLLRCVDIATSAVNALRIDGLFMSRTVRYVDTRAELVVRNATYVYAVRFEARRVVPNATNPDPSVTVESIHGDINLRDTPGDAVEPLVQFIATPDP